MAEVRYAGATCVYPGNPAPAVDSLNLTVPDGEFMVLVGPSGSGKSTALRMIAGLEDVASGEIYINGEEVSNKSPKERDIAMVFQNYALYPHMSVSDNMGFALKMRGVPKAEREMRVRRAAVLLELVDYLARKPKALSGGQRQRVAMGRAIVREPSVFLMDEPLSNLDAKLRVETRANIASLQAQLGTTTIFVTHDQVEAMTLGHRVAVLKSGQLQQCDVPRVLYERPANAFVAAFIGSPAMNLRLVDICPGGVSLGNVTIPINPTVTATAARLGLSRLNLGLRPESLSVRSAGDGPVVEVKLIEELGADAYVYGSLPGDTPAEKPMVVRVNSRVSPRIGETIHLAVAAGEGHAFHPETGERIG